MKAGGNLWNQRWIQGLRQILAVLSFVLLGILAMKLPQAWLGRPAKQLLMQENVLMAFLLMVGMQGLVLLLMLLLAWVYVKGLDRSEFKNVGLFFGDRSLRLWGTGVLTAMLMGAISSGIYLFRHSPSFTPVHQSLGSALAVFLLGSLATLFQTAAEEIWLRSYVLFKLENAMGKLAASLLVGLLFGAAHLLNLAYSLPAVLSAASGGLMCSLAVLNTRSLWLALGLHFGWNLITSGLIYNRFLFQVVSQEGQRITAFDGAEATLAGVILPLLVSLAMLYVFSGKRENRFSDRPVLP